MHQNSNETLFQNGALWACSTFAYSNILHAQFSTVRREWAGFQCTIRRRRQESWFVLKVLKRTFFDEKKCLKYVVVENRHQRDGNWLNQRSMNWIRKCEKVNFPSKTLWDFHAFSDHGTKLDELYTKPFVILYLSLSSAETEPHEGKRKTESMWPIFR